MTTAYKPKIVKLDTGRVMQEINCVKCGGFAMHRVIDWQPRAHHKGTICRKCCDHKVSKATTNRPVGKKTHVDV